MTKTEAIDILVGVIETHSEEENEALDLAIEALQQPRVVYCRNCKHSIDTGDYQDTYFCDNPHHDSNHLVHSLEYCSHGKPKEKLQPRNWEVLRGDRGEAEKHQLKHQLSEETSTNTSTNKDIVEQIENHVERIEQETDKNPDSLWSKGMHSFDGMEKVLENRGVAEPATTTDCNDRGMRKYIDKDTVLEYIIFGVVGKDITCGELTRSIESIPTIEVSEDCISREQVIKMVHKYFVDEINKSPYEIDEDGDEVYTDMKAVNELFKHNKHISKAIKALPPVTPTERTGEWIPVSESNKENHDGEV